MRIAIGQFRELDKEMLLFAKQLGIDSMQMNIPQIPGEKIWEYKDLLALKERFKEYGLKLEMIENVPTRFYEKVMLGLNGRDEQVENYQNTIRMLGKLGIKIFGHHFNPTFVWRTSLEAEGRGGSKVTAFDEGKAKDAPNALNEIMRKMEAESTIEKLNKKSEKGEQNVWLTKEELFANYKYFVDAIIPVAEEAGVQLALHPSDPPVDVLSGVEEIFNSPESLLKILEITDSKALGANLCLGTCSEMKGGADNVRKLIRAFGEQKRLFCVHFRDVQGSLPSFKECFLGEGNYNPAEMMLELEKVNYDGLLLIDHVPKMANDSLYGHRARANQIGYLQGLINMMEYLFKK